MRFPRGIIQLHLVHTRGDDKVSGQYFFLNDNSIYLLSHAAPTKYSPCNLITMTAPVLEAFVNVLCSDSANAACDHSSVLLMS